tara:strand:+ start:500 stop:931 length:432 start_codon:yes stop_codon:yes gene_type:complete
MAKAKVKKAAPKKTAAKTAPKKTAPKTAPKEEPKEEKVAVEEEVVEEVVEEVEQIVEEVEKVVEEVVEEKVVEEKVPASAKNLERSANTIPGVRTETFRAPYEGDLNLHIDRFVSENDIGAYKVVEISPPDDVDDYWQKVIEY